MFSCFFHKEPYEYKYTKEELKIIDTMEDIYGNAYDYSKVRYRKHFKITLVCPEHGDFSSSFKILTFGGGCPKCKNRRTANRVSKYLNI
tara:strand:+ start:297 stop:563 length:267 start_codon:yes stop_codon:yes gene_type:complete